MNEDLTSQTDRVVTAISRDALMVVEDACLRPTAEGRAMIERFVNSLSFEPMVGVKHNGNVTLAQHPAVIEEMAAANSLPKYGCLMAMLPSMDSMLPNWAADNIPANCLHEDGIETEPHVTVLYGFDLGFDSGRLFQALLGLRAVDMTFGPVSRFECEEYDVLKLTVHSASLVKTNAHLANVFKDNVTVTKWVAGDGYNPHVTIAYVKKGECKELDGRTDFQGYKARVSQLVYSLPDQMGRKVIDLNGPPAAVEGSRRVPVSFEASNAQDDRTDTQKAHDHIRKEAQKSIERAVAQIVALAEAEAIAKKKRDDDEFFLFAAALFAAAIASSYGRSAKALSAVAGNQDDGVMKIDEDNFAKERSKYLENFPRNVREKIDGQVAQGAAAGEDERKTAERIRTAGDEILEGEGAMVAETESQAIYGHAQLRALKRAGYETMFWIQLDRPSKRDSHEQNMNEGEVKIGHTFKASNQKFPGDPAGGAGECINCLCYLEGASRRPT